MISIRRTNGTILFSGNFKSVKGLLKHKMSKSKNGGLTFDCANLNGLDLSMMDLTNCKFICCRLENIDFSYTNLMCCKFSSSTLSNINLTYANLSESDLSEINSFRDISFTCTNMGSCNCKHIDFRYSTFINTYLGNANFQGSDLSCCKISNIHIDYKTLGLQKAPEGELIGYKKLCNDKICKLKIPADSKRSCATTRKFRCEYAYVISGAGSSGYNRNFIYKPGTFVYADHFERNRWKECAGGIHFFLTREEAVAWNY